MLALGLPRSYNRPLHDFTGTLHGSLESDVVECTDAVRHRDEQVAGRA